MKESETATGLWGGTSTMHRLLQQWNGSDTSLGPVASWSSSLRSLVRFYLDAPQPMELWWGAELGWLSNDAYRRVGLESGCELGQPARSGEPQRWAELELLLEQVRATGQAVEVSQQRLACRSGLRTETYWHCVYSPLRDEDGTIAGVSCTYQDITASVRETRRWSILRQVTTRLATALTPTDVVTTATLAVAMLDPYRQQHPSAVLYGLDASGSQAYLLADLETVLETAPETVPETATDLLPWIDLTALDLPAWNDGRSGIADGIAAAVRTRQPVRRSWDENGAESVVLPLTSPSQPLRGVLVVSGAAQAGEPDWLDWFSEWIAPPLALALERVGVAAPDSNTSLLPLYIELVNQMRLGIVVWRLDDLADPGSFRLLLANPAASQATGVDFAQLINTTMAERFPALLQTPLVEQYTAVVQSGQPQDLGDVLYDQDGITQGVYSLKAFALPDHCLGLVFENITVRKQMEAALHESEARYRLLTETVPSLIWTCDADGTCDYVNPSYQDFTGLSLEQALGDDWLQMIHPEDRDSCWQRWQQSLLTGEPYEVEVRYRHQTGCYRWVLARGLPLYDEAGNRIKWVGASTDIHERKQRELDARFLADLSERIRIETEADAFLATVASLIGHHLQVSRCFFSEVDQQQDRATIARDYHQGLPSLAGELRLSSFSRQDMDTLAAGQTIVNRDVQHDVRTRALYAAVHRPLGVGAFVTVPLLRQGQWVFALCVSVETARDWSAEEIALLEVVAERTWLAVEKLRLDAALQESEERFRLAARAVPGIVYDWDVQAGTVYRSEGLYTLLGLAADAIPASRDWWTEQIHPEDLARLLPIMSEIMEGSSDRYDCEYRVRHADGHWIEVWDRGYLIRNRQGQLVRVVGSTANITERKRMEQQLRQANERITTILESMSDGFVALDSEWRITYLNQQAAQLMQVSPQAVIGQTHWEVWPWSVGQLPEQMYRQAMHEQTPMHFEVIYEPSQTWYEIHAYPSEAGLGIFFRNIHDSKQAEAALRASEARYRMLVEAVPQMMWINDAAGNAEYFNTRCQEYTGRTSSERQGINWQSDLHPDDLAAVIALRSRAIAQGEAYEVECRLRCVDQVYRWHLARVVPLKNDAGEILCWFGTATDIHDLKQAEVAQRLLAQASSVLVSSLEVQTTLSSIVQLVVPTLADYCVFDVLTPDGTVNRIGWQHRDPAKREWFSQVQRFADAPSRPQHPVQQALAHNQPILISDITDTWLQQIAISPEHLQFLRDCELASLLIVPLVARQRQLGVLHLCFTRSSLRRYTDADVALAEELAHRMALALDNAQLYQQAQDANRIKDEFLAVLSHELRSPLNPILGWTKLLQSRTFDAQTTARALDTIERNVKLQAQLIEDLLDVSRILRGKLALTVAPVNLVTTIEAALDTVRLAADAKTITIETQLDPSVGRVAGDANRLQQVFWNLLSNAVKFTPAGGRVEVKLERYEFSVLNSESSDPTQNSNLKTQNYAQITITDTGKGISREFLPYVFDYFRQEDGRTTRQFGGLGLGLAIVHHLTELHGGTVRAESAGEGQGATFIVRLPLLPTDRNRMAAEAPAAAPAVPMALADMQILVVDDEADMRELMAMVLQQQGARVRLAASAAEAMQQLQSSQSLPDLLISDIGMPDVDGYMLLQQLRCSPSVDQLPAIALTAYAGEGDQQQAMAAGFQAHLAKPVEPDELVAAILRVLQRRAG